MCGENANACPKNKQKNSAGLRNAYNSGIRKPASDLYKALPTETKERMNWNKGNNYAIFEYGGKGGHKSALIKERGRCCEVCKLSEWNFKPITLELEHVDGDGKNNVKENLKLLCPNCHSQTPTWRRRKDTGNVKRQSKHSDEEIIDAIKTSENLHQVLSKLDLRYGSAGGIVSIMSKYGVTFKDSNI